MCEKPGNVTWEIQHQQMKMMTQCLSTGFLMEQVICCSCYKHLNLIYIGTAYREYGLVYKGKNFNETRGVASLEECIQMCKDSARCKFWWYEFKNNQRCCLKEGKSGKLLWGPGFVAGNKP